MSEGLASVAICVYLMSDQPTTCPRCGMRTEFEQAGDEQNHDCPACRYRFTVIEDDDPLLDEDEGETDE